jgi:hypothetical protein
MARSSSCWIEDGRSGNLSESRKRSRAAVGQAFVIQPIVSGRQSCLGNLSIQPRQRPNNIVDISSNPVGRPAHELFDCDPPHIEEQAGAFALHQLVVNRLALVIDGRSNVVGAGSIVRKWRWREVSAHFEAS